MEVIQYKFKKFSKIVAKLCILGEIPIYNSKFSNRIFTNIQHLFLLVAKENTTYDYRKFVESLYDSKIPNYISLNRIPHFTTLQKFAKRVEAKLLHLLIFMTRNLFKSQGTFFGADSTGLELDHASAHYCKRIDRFQPVKGFVNLNALSDLYNKIILVTKIRKHRRHDTVDFGPMFNKVKNLDFDYFVADKGYDSEKNHKFVFESGKHSLISLKNQHIPIHKTKGRYRKLAKRNFETALYTQRELTESIFSSLKRKYGSKLRARKFKTQKIELLCRILSYNIERAIKSVIQILCCARAFLQSRIGR
jgi:hypothetical protein